ncbi:branched-chain amino acid ABC transporter substrate-binding protein [Echinicola strongylocentroti]|uniref:Branched-chain amino acid ABC transporter substrate-binding protein n=1 Tax=Echinicola strongylocentroti TaxID=1795355 RepID=A0A2Z4IGZ5_9BACT|nr:ABC transporter substrate-binding protein [Echinicola strongylocentroti]AWW29940.1 branched-chain amino acid ABC transporter substrate-binding protein [Echinicola strongylocentroti]
MKKINILLLLALMCIGSLKAQETGTGYRSAVRLIDSGQPAEALDQLRPYLDYTNYGKLSLYAHFHFARAAFKNKQYQLAKATLEQLVTDYNWEQEDEALYLLGTTEFALNQAYDGLNAIGKIKRESLREEGYRASYDYLSNNATVSLLVAHYTSFKANKGYDLALKEKLLQQSSLTSNEKKLLSELESMNLEGQEGTGGSMEKVENDVLDVAIILPFNYQGGSGVNNLEGGNFVFELYQGLDMAIKDAERSGAAINVKTFDTERNDGVVKKILSDPYFRMADVIVGPIYPEETALVADFADKHQIPFINPLSNIKENFGDTKYAYLFRPSTEVIVEKLLDYSRRHVTGNRIALAYSGSSRDELMARQFAAEASKRGYRVVFNEKVGSNSIRDFLSNVGLKPGETSRADQIVIFSDDPYIASPTLSLMESLSTSTPVFVLDSWLYFNFANFEMLDGTDLNYIGNNTVNFGKEITEDFRFRFFEKYSSYPGANAYIGFDLMNWVAGTVNSRKGFDFGKNLDRQGEVKSGLGFGLDFRNSQSNQYVPVLKLNEGKIEEIK